MLGVVLDTSPSHRICTCKFAWRRQKKAATANCPHSAFFACQGERLHVFLSQERGIKIAVPISMQACRGCPCPLSRNPQRAAISQSQAPHLSKIAPQQLFPQDFTHTRISAQKKEKPTSEVSFLLLHRRARKSKLEWSWSGQNTSCFLFLAKAVQR